MTVVSQNDTAKSMKSLAVRDDFDNKTEHDGAFTGNNV
jgi:hypothetical protein